MRASSCVRWSARASASPSRRRSTRSTTTARSPPTSAARCTSAPAKRSYGASQRLLTRALGLAESAQDAAERAEVRAALAEVRYLRGEYAEAERLCNEGLAEGDAVPNMARVALTNIIGKVRLHRESYDD